MDLHLLTPFILFVAFTCAIYGYFSPIAFGHL